VGDTEAAIPSVCQSYLINFRILGIPTKSFQLKLYCQSGSDSMSPRLFLFVSVFLSQPFLFLLLWRCNICTSLCHPRPRFQKSSQMSFRTHTYMDICLYIAKFMYRRLNTCNRLFVELAYLHRCSYIYIYIIYMYTYVDTIM